jgi:hypothetical protein
MAHFKTIMLGILEENGRKPSMEELDRYSMLLKSSHADWKGHLKQENPNQPDGQIASEALELAIMDLQDCLASGSLPEETLGLPLSLDAAMVFIRNQTRHA